MQVLAGAGLLNAIVTDDIRVISRPHSRRGAMIIPMPELERFLLKPPCGGKTAARALTHGASVPAAACILLEGIVGLADWQCHRDHALSELLTFGAVVLGAQISRSDTVIPAWNEADLLDRASKRGKGQLPSLLGCLYKGSTQHVSLKGGGNDIAQLKVAAAGCVTMAEKYTLCHSAHVSIRFLAVTWDRLQSGPESDQDDPSFQDTKEQDYNEYIPDFSGSEG